MSKDQGPNTNARQKPTFNIEELVKRGGLNPGRLKQTGLGAAMQQAVSVTPADAAQAAGNTILDIPLADLHENAKLQPRLKVHESDIQEMADSLAAKGQLEIIKVRRRQEGGYEIISGYHRFYGAKRANLPSLKAEVVELSDNEAWLAALVSNDARIDMSDFERAYAYRHMLDSGLVGSQNQLAKIVKRTAARVSQCLKMLELPDGVQNVLLEHPDLFGYRTALGILELRQKHAPTRPDIDDVIASAVQALTEGEKVDALLSDIEKKLADPTAPRSAKTEAAYVTDNSGRKVFSARNAGRAITIKWPASVSHDSGKLMAHLLESLEKFHATEARKHGSQQKRKQPKSDS